MKKIFTLFIYFAIFAAAFTLVYFYPSSNLKAKDSNSPSKFDLSIPFQQSSYWETFNFENGKFISKPSDTWFVYGWFGAIESNKTFSGYQSFDNKHQGIDFAAKEGLPVVATADGKVVSTSRLYGNTVIIQHQDGFQSVYGHLSSISIKNNQPIKKGMVIGKVGHSGTINPHLHFEIRRTTQTGTWYVNPYRLIKTDWKKVLVPDFPANRFFENNQYDPANQPDFVSNRKV